MFKHIAYYKPDLEACIDRVRRFFEAAPGAPSALLYTFPSVMTFHGPRLNEYDFETELDRYLDDYLSFQAQLMEIRRGLEDDWVPAVGPYLGIGEYSAFVAGDIEFGADTSWTKPVLADKPNLRDLRLDPSNRWFTRLNQATRYIVEKISPSRIPFGRGYYSPLDLAWALRGEDIYTDFYDDPPWVHELLEFCTSATIWFASAQNKVIFTPDLVHSLSAWHCAPDRLAVSEDISSLCSAAHYREFGAPYTQEAFRAFGKGDIHCHSAGPHVIPEFLKLKRVRQVQIVADPNQTRPVKILEALISNHPEAVSRAATCPVIAVDASPDEVEACFELSKLARVVFSVVTDNAAEAREAVSMFRAKQGA